MEQHPEGREVSRVARVLADLEANLGRVLSSPAAVAAWKAMARRALEEDLSNGIGAALATDSEVVSGLDPRVRPLVATLIAELDVDPVLALMSNRRTDSGRPSADRPSQAAPEVPQVPKVDKRWIKKASVEEIEAAFVEMVIERRRTLLRVPARQSNRMVELIIAMREELTRRGDAGRAAVERLVKNKNSGVKLSIAGALVHYDRERTLALLRDLTTDPDTIVGEDARNGLWYFETQQDK